MRARLTAFSSLLVGGAIGYSVKPSFDRPNYPVNPQLQTIAQSFRQRGFTEISERKNWWHQWHKQYMYSNAVSARPECGFIDPDNETTELYYSIPTEYQANFDRIYPAILDEGLGSVAFRALPNRVGVTGTLEIGPCRMKSSDITNGEESRILVLRASKPQGSGRKSVCTGELSWYGSNKVIASGKVIMIEPWWGKYIALVM